MMVVVVVVARCGTKPSLSSEAAMVVNTMRSFNGGEREGRGAGGLKLNDRQTDEQGRAHYRCIEQTRPTCLVRIVVVQLGKEVRTAQFAFGRSGCYTFPPSTS